MIEQRFQSTFRSNERKIRKSKTSGKGTEDIYKPKWEYYDSLLYLRKSCEQAESIDNYSQMKNDNASFPYEDSCSITVCYDDNTTINIKLI